MQDAVEKYVINKKGATRRSFEKQASLERQTSSKLIEDISSSSNGSTSPDRNIRQRTEVLPNEFKASPATSNLQHQQQQGTQFSPLNPRPYIRSNLATARLKPLKDRSASQPSLHNTVSQSLRLYPLKTKSPFISIEPKKRDMHRDFYFQRNQTRLNQGNEQKIDHTRNRQPIIVPNDDYENNNTSSVNNLS